MRETVPCFINDLKFISIREVRFNRDPFDMSDNDFSIFVGDYCLKDNLSKHAAISIARNIEKEILKLC